ncbi:MAG: SWF/SNF helicase family protein [Bacteroidales bacterium]|nr:SWF/SNF helicase family protein [Bacteroidales bacterium]
MVILQGLTRLRQIANHPSMVDETYKFDSGKMEEILRRLDNLHNESHKVLIFSTFVKHLKLVAGELDARNYGYCMLTGETHKRKEVIDEFIANDSKSCFLISLKAGGVGLNLTVADYVFMLDPWWNPAAEAQAINRAHRIGQKNNVFVYRFISHNSIEEKIVHLQQRKKELADTFVNSANPFKSFNKDSIMKLFD